MSGFEEMAKRIGSLAEALEEIGEIVKSTPPSADNPEKIAEKLGTRLDDVLQGPTPLSETPEAAQQEFEQKIGTRMEQLGKVITQKLKDSLG